MGEGNDFRGNGMQGIRALRGHGLVLLALSAITACGNRAVEPPVVVVAAPARLSFGVPRVLSAVETLDATAMTAVSPTGVHASVWTATPPGEGTLQLRLDDTSTQALPDRDGPAGMDPETPAKVAFGPKGELYIAYAVARQGPLAGDRPTIKWRDDQRAALRVIRSDDSGKSWTAPVSIADDGAWGAYRSDHAFHVTATGTVFAAWIDGRDANVMRIYVARSDDRGVTWSKNIAVDQGGACECCRMALASSVDGRVYVAWRKVLPGSIRDIVVASSADQGLHWSAPVVAHADGWQVEQCPDAGPSMFGEANGRLHLVWWTGKAGAAGVSYVSSPDGGKTWGTAVPLKIGAASRSSHAQIARGADGALYIAWDDGISKDPQILLAVSHDDGKSFDEPLVVSEPGAMPGYPSLAVSPHAVTVVWHQADPKSAAHHQVIARTAMLP
jgi:BNR repeat-like domain